MMRRLRQKRAVFLVRGMAWVKAESCVLDGEALGEAVNHLEGLDEARS